MSYYIAFMYVYFCWQLAHKFLRFIHKSLANRLLAKHKIGIQKCDTNWNAVCFGFALLNVSAFLWDIHELFIEIMHLPDYMSYIIDILALNFSVLFPNWTTRITTTIKVDKKGAKYWQKEERATKAG